MNSLDNHSEEEQAQTGIRIEKRALKVFKAIAEYNDETPSELLEKILKHAYRGASKPYFDQNDLERIKSLKSVYGLDEGLDEPPENVSATSNGGENPWAVVVENFGEYSGMSRHRTNTKAYDFAMELVRKSNDEGVKMRRGGVQGDGRRWDSRDLHSRSILIQKVPLA